MIRAARRALVLLLVGLVVLLVVADRLTEQAAEHAVAIKARQAALLASTPSVSIKGFPFLTQAAAGRFKEIVITTHGIHRDGLRLETVTATFYGVHVSLVKALDGKLTSVRIDHSTGDLLVDYADLNTYLASRHLSVADDSGSLHVTGSETIAGVKASVGADFALSLDGNSIELTPDATTLRDATGLLPGSAQKAVLSALSVRIDTGSLPFGLTLKSIALTPLGIECTAVAGGLVVPVPADAAQVG